MEVLRQIRQTISPNNPVGQRFAGGIDLHGQLTANAFSYTLLGAGQRDFRKNFSTVDQGLRTWEDQTARLAWSPYIGTVFERGRPVGHGHRHARLPGLRRARRLDRERGDRPRRGRHRQRDVALAPRPEQRLRADHRADAHRRQQGPDLLAARLDADRAGVPVSSRPGKIGYVVNPVRITATPERRARRTRACRRRTTSTSSCRQPDPNFELDGTAYNLEFDVKGPNDGHLERRHHRHDDQRQRVAASHPASLARLSLQRCDEDSENWQNVATSFVQGGNARRLPPVRPGRDRQRPDAGALARPRHRTAAAPALVRVKVDFNPVTAEDVARAGAVLGLLDGLLHRPQQVHRATRPKRREGVSDRGRSLANPRDARPVRLARRRQHASAAAPS